LKVKRSSYWGWLVKEWLWPATLHETERILVSDSAPTEQLQPEIGALADLPIKLALGGHPISLLDGTDLLCLSGGVPPQLEIVQTAIARGIRLSNDSLLTMQLCRQHGLGPIIAVTGSSGKTTTATLVGEMLAASGRPCMLAATSGVR
jgi:UDP-N-acetylmuramoylalanine--D-glutamate ligase